MKNADLWNSYKEQTQTLSDNCRKLAFAAAGLSWMFKTDIASFPPAVRIALGGIVAFFLFDLLQFFVGVVLLRYWTRCEERKRWASDKSLDGDYEKPAWIDMPSFILWWSKIIVLLLAYACLGVHVMEMN